MDGGTVAPARRSKGMERSFADQVRNLTKGAGEVFEGEAIVAVTKGLLQSGVGYVGGYPGAPVSHLMDVLADANDEILHPLGIHFEQAASEAGAAAMLGASIHYPLRGAVTWKSIVGTNVASDALSNLASAGVTGGALIVVGEDYGEGASVIQERTHAMAMKSSLPLIDPRYDMAKIVDLTEAAFELSEACNLPVVMSLRIRAAHMTGSFVCKDNRAPAEGRNTPHLDARFDYDKIVLPPSIYAQEKAKVEHRLPAARDFIVRRGLNEINRGAEGNRYGIILQGGTYGVVMRALARLGAADAFGNTDVPLLILNVIHPLVPDQITDFIADKDSVLVVEEGNPAFIEEQVRSLAQAAGITCRIRGKDVLPVAGEYIAPVVRQGIAAYLGDAAPGPVKEAARTANGTIAANVAAALENAGATAMPVRPPGFCTGCPERPIFTAMKLIMQERGRLHISSDIGCNTFATLPPFNVGSTVLGYGLSLASGGALAGALDQPTIAIMGDGGFWHNGLTTGAINAQWQGLDTVLIILDNGYASATGQHHIPSSGSTPQGRPAVVSIESTLKGIGVKWIRKVDSYSVGESKKVIEEALDARGQGLRVVISDAECMLAKKRRGNRHKARAEKAGRPIRVSRFGVDEEVCTGDHSCMRLSGCPSLTLRAPSDPLKDGPTATVDENCVACALCGEAAHAARLCPSFYKAKGTRNPDGWSRLAARVNGGLMKMLGAS
ncbi:MAG: indolepyruvate ferredoxin oxidoreductase subunit alpha [Hyphomicrobiales bacterium]|nr:indolepyruvate ferredoxin oxidoreductase subunit alpha [Hyphomicrobiales bacterium]